MTAESPQPSTVTAEPKSPGQAAHDTWRKGDPAGLQDKYWDGVAESAIDASGLREQLAAVAAERDALQDKLAMTPHVPEFDDGECKLCGFGADSWRHGDAPHALAAVTAENERLNAELMTALIDPDRLRDELAAAEAERDTLKAQLAADEEAFGHYRDEVARITAERARYLEALEQAALAESADGARRIALRAMEAAEVPGE